VRLSVRLSSEAIPGATYRSVRQATRGHRREQQTTEGKVMRQNTWD
jgi:hypothetical protein